MIVFSHPTGNANVREAVRALNEAGLLFEFWTSVCWNQGHLLNRVLPRSVSRELGRRAFFHIGRDQLRCHPWVELGRLAARQLNLSSLARHEVGRFSVDAVYRSLDSRVAARVHDVPNISGLYAYEDGALASFRAARQLGIKTIYELPIGYWRCYRELMRQEASLQPDWASTLQGSGDSDEKLQRKDEELALATDIIVPSEFVRGSLQKAGRLEARVSVVPYGAPPAERTTRDKRGARDGILKVLFVGGLSQRKGLSYLLRAAKRLGSKIELTLIGRKVAECRALDAALRAHRWIPSLSHSALLEEMSRHDVMVLPSLFEGCALVVLEAMSQGVPVVTTPNTGVSHFVSDGDDGFIIPIRDVEAIVEKLEMLILNRDLLAAMSQAAIHKAAQHSWEQYRHRLASTVRLALMNDTAARSTLLQSSHLQVHSSC
jgi:alpha-maltose-1-phosphate synthase